MRHTPSRNAHTVVAMSSPRKLAQTHTAALSLVLARLKRWFFGNSCATQKVQEPPMYKMPVDLALSMLSASGGMTRARRKRREAHPLGGKQIARHELEEVGPWRHGTTRDDQGRRPGQGQATIRVLKPRLGDGTLRCRNLAKDTNRLLMMLAALPHPRMVRKRLIAGLTSMTAPAARGTRSWPILWR